jgi:putative membrane protein
VIASRQKNNIALFIAILFHACGLVGILCTPYKDWFIQNTSITLLLMALLLVWTQQQKNSWFFLFLISAWAVGMCTEIIGTNTGLLFGSYKYGNMLGTKFKNVPLLIGINWFVIIYCSGAIVTIFDDWILRKLGGDARFSSLMLTLSFIIDAALLTTLFDWLMEPVAIKLGFWQWLADGTPPLFNYTCWFLISALLLALFRWLKFSKHNHFAVHLFIIQLLFFLTLRTFL